MWWDGGGSEVLESESGLMSYESGLVKVSYELT